MVWILDKVLGSDLDLKGPNLDNAPWLELDFSGTTLRYRDPMHTAMFPVNVFAKDMNIFDVNHYEEQESGHQAMRFYIKGWAFTGRGRRGGVDLSARVIYFSNKLGHDHSCFEKDSFEDEVFEFCHRGWGWQNESREVGDLGKKLFIYPVESTDLNYLKINGINWCHFSPQAKGKPPEVHYAYPLTAHHILVLKFTLLGYGATDFYSLETNLEQATLAFVDEFMANFYIELSPESKAQRAAAKNPV